MLDRPKVMKELQANAQKLFIDLSYELMLARKVWETIVNDPTFQQKLAQAHAPWLIPSWTERLNKVYHAASDSTPEYCVSSVDGSQIYPDRHQGTSCCLINIGSVSLSYSAPRSVALYSKPFIFVADEYSDLENPVELVNCRRQELELTEGLASAQELQKKYPNQLVVSMFDGSLIFWHLEGKEQRVKEEFIAKYIYALHQFYLLKIPIIGYISLPKSKELVNLIRMKLANFDPEHIPHFKKVEHLVDTHIVQFFLNPGQRTIFFASNSHITNYYPPHLKPYFFYIHLGQEIVRIELPAWLIHDECIEQVTNLIIDQANKGNGYPICLAEAHEQAVVKGPDRDFFYHVIQKISFEHKQHLHFSQKSIKKRGIGI